MTYLGYSYILDILLKVEHASRSLLCSQFSTSFHSKDSIQDFDIKWIGDGLMPLPYALGCDVIAFGGVLNKSMPFLDCI